jgi:hypothetical protein
MAKGEKDWKQNRVKPGSGRLLFIRQGEEREEQAYSYKMPDLPPTRRQPPWPLTARRREDGSGI